MIFGEANKDVDWGLRVNLIAMKVIQPLQRQKGMEKSNKNPAVEA